METQETILIFQEPQLYFFPHYKNITFKPYSDDILRKYDFHHWLSNFDS